MQHPERLTALQQIEDALRLVIVRIRPPRPCAPPGRHPGGDRVLQAEARQLLERVASVGDEIVVRADFPSALTRRRGGWEFQHGDRGAPGLELLGKGVDGLEQLGARHAPVGAALSYGKTSAWRTLSTSRGLSSRGRSPGAGV
jgi:hypothetical protein